MSATHSFETVRLPEERTAFAPDGSEIRELVRTDAASLAHCTLPPGVVSRAVRHRVVEELWYVLSGRGQIWRKSGDREDLLEATPGCSLSVRTGVSFQFRNTGAEPLVLLIATVPPWPGEEEAERPAGRWPDSVSPD